MYDFLVVGLRAGCGRLRHGSQHIAYMLRPGTQWAPEVADRGGVADGCSRSLCGLGDRGAHGTHHAAARVHPSQGPPARSPSVRCASRSRTIPRDRADRHDDRGHRGRRVRRCTPRAWARAHVRQPAASAAGHRPRRSPPSSSSSRSRSLVVGELGTESHSRCATAIATRSSSRRPLRTLSQAAPPAGLGADLSISNLFLRCCSATSHDVHRRRGCRATSLQQLVEEAAKTGSVDPRAREIAARARRFGVVTVADVKVPAQSASSRCAVRPSPRRSSA